MGPTSVYHIPDGACQRSVRGRVSTSVVFPSNDLCVIGDGAGKLHIIDTGPRGDSGTWKVRETCCGATTHSSSNIYSIDR